MVVSYVDSYTNSFATFVNQNSSYGWNLLNMSSCLVLSETICSHEIIKVTSAYGSSEPGAEEHLQFWKFIDLISAIFWHVNLITLFEPANFSTVVARIGKSLHVGFYVTHHVTSLGPMLNAHSTFPHVVSISVPVH